MRVKFTINYIDIVGYCFLGTESNAESNNQPCMFRYNDQITVTYDVSRNFTSKSCHTWVGYGYQTLRLMLHIISTQLLAIQHQLTMPNAPSPRQAGKHFSTITFKPSDFFSSSISTQTQLGIFAQG